MRKTANLACLSILLTVALLLTLIPSVSVGPVSAHPGKMIWSIVDTPSAVSNVIVSPSEVNVIAIGSDDMTFYAVDIPNSSVHKSTDGGVTWITELGLSLTAAGANLPAWNLAVAPDDVNFLVAITDGGLGDPGPRRVCLSEDGGANWTHVPASTLSLPAGEYFSCVDISVFYGTDSRDVAIGTRDGVGGGRVYVLHYTGVGGSWNPQDATGSPSSIGWPGGDVAAVRFSPTYISDSTLAVVYSNGAGTFLNAGQHDLDTNYTDWTAIYGASIELTTAGVGTSPDNTEIITADLELPSDFSGSDSGLRRYYVSTDATAAGVQSGVYRVDDTVVFYIKPPTVAPTAGRISSIAYHGTYAEGVLLAGEVTAGQLAPTPSSYGVYIWRTSNPNATALPPVWLNSNNRKSPTGGFISGFANAQLAWSPDGARAYCGTSSACLGVFNLPDGAINCAVLTEWPDGHLNSVPLDESAFSVSPYAPAYGDLLVFFYKTTDTAIGNIWNQLSLIDTGMSPPAFLSDVAVLEVPEEEVLADYNVLYLVSINPAGLDSIWRSTSDPLGTTWERVLCIDTSDTGTILRVRQTPYEDLFRSDVIVFADLGTDIVGYSGGEGQLWDVRFFTTVTDLALAGDGLIYILDGVKVYRYVMAGGGWSQTHSEDTGLGFGHTIAVPLKNPAKEGEAEGDWVIVGGAAPPAGFSGVAWADFSQDIVDFAPSILERAETPVRGNVHVIADDRFEQNRIVYAATQDAAGNSGGIYRWLIDRSNDWDELQPPNSAFYGLAQRNDVLYGAWRTPQVPAIIALDAGVDRTIYPRASVPPPLEWDYLTEGLTIGVLFTREPCSLKISSNEYNSIWAIDDRQYDWPNGIGCLWAYADIVAKVGPWTTSPPSGDIILVDPVTGRPVEINFEWRQLSYALSYELQLAKDSDFSIVVLGNDNITPLDPLSPAVYFPAGGLVPTSASDSALAGWANLESGHTYYWRVRARVAVVGEPVRSPWSATMYFTVGAGLPVMAEYPTITLFNPTYGARGVPRSPAFSWSPMFKTARYEFVLAKDAALQQVVVKTNVSQTSYMYDEELDFNTSYFWQVRAIEPVVSDPSPIGTFTVVAEEKPVGPATEEPTAIPFWVWGVIAVCTALVAVMIAFAMVKPGRISTRTAPVNKPEVFGEKPRHNPIAKIWNSIKMGARRRRYLGKRGGGGLDDL